MQNNRPFNSLLTFVSLIFKTILKSSAALAQQKMSGLIPFFLGLIVFSLLMVFINAVSPMAPFVYSLF